MRIVLASAAIAAFAFAATPAVAQYGGSPAEQVDGAPAEIDEAQAPEDEAMPMASTVDTQIADVDADPGLDVDADPEDTGGVAGGGKPAAAAEDYALADMDADLPMDMDVDADADADMDAGEPVAVAPGEPFDEAEEAGEAIDEVGPEDEGDPSED